MHPSSVFHQRDPDALASFVRERAFGILVGTDGGRSRIAHVPLLLDSSGSGWIARFHLSRANPLNAALADGATALLVVSGPDAYVSPDWYGLENQVPTWNYLSAELEGIVTPLSNQETVVLLDELSAYFEARLAPKPPWTRAKMAPGTFEALVRGVLGYTLHLNRFEGIQKLSQNKPEATREKVAAALAHGTDVAAHAVAKRMRAP